MELQLLRQYLPNGTNGSLIHNGKLLCNTIELPWLNNLPGRSCIPEGRYKLTLRNSRRFGQHLLLNEVSNRTLILIHPANSALLELRGCIAPVSMLTGAGRGVFSKPAFGKLMAIVMAAIKHEPVFLIIKKQQHDHPTTVGGTHTAVL